MRVKNGVKNAKIEGKSLGKRRMSVRFVDESRNDWLF
jgi:hypothetical protein